MRQDSGKEQSQVFKFLSHGISPRLYGCAHFVLGEVARDADVR